MLTSSQKAFLVMHQLRRYAGMTVVETHFMHKLNETAYSRILKFIMQGRHSGMNGMTDLNVQKSIRRLKAGFELGLLKYDTQRISKVNLAKFDVKTRHIRGKIKAPLDDSFQVALKKARILCEL
jgi:hypothetical protein